MTFTFGQTKITPIVDDVEEFRLDFFFRPGFKIDNYKDFLLNNETFQCFYGGYYVETRGKKIFIDAGVKRANGFKSPDHTGHFLENVKKLGINPEEISDVILSHLHPDHIGWLSNDGKPVFPNAKIIVHEADFKMYEKFDFYDYTGYPHIKETMAPVLHQIQTINKDTAFNEDIDLICAPGHTLGELAIVIKGETNRLVILGDIAHHEAELVDDDWTFIVDLDHEQTLKTKAHWKNECLKPNTIFTSTHFPEIQFNKATKNADGTIKVERVYPDKVY